MQLPPSHVRSYVLEAGGRTVGRCIVHFMADRGHCYGAVAVGHPDLGLFKRRVPAAALRGCSSSCAVGARGLRNASPLLAACRSMMAMTGTGSVGECILRECRVPVIIHRGTRADLSAGAPQRHPALCEVPAFTRPLICFPINFADRLIGSPISSQSTAHLYTMNTKDAMYAASLYIRMRRSRGSCRKISVTSVVCCPIASVRALKTTTGTLMAAIDHLPQTSSSAVKAACTAYSGTCAQCSAKRRLAGDFDRLSGQSCRLLDRLAAQLALHRLRTWAGERGAVRAAPSSALARSIDVPERRAPRARGI